LWWLLSNNSGIGWRYFLKLISNRRKILVNLVYLNLPVPTAYCCIIIIILTTHQNYAWYRVLKLMWQLYFITIHLISVSHSHLILVIRILLLKLVILLSSKKTSLRRLSSTKLWIVKQVSWCLKSWLSLSESCWISSESWLIASKYRFLIILTKHTLYF
jgi:hypothetical protein